MQNFEKRQTVRRLWLERPPDRRTDRDLVIFHEWLLENLPNLLRGSRDSFQNLKATLGELCEATAPEPARE